MSIQSVRRVMRSRRDEQRGLVIVWFAMLLIVMMVAAAFTVDVGAWYLRGNNIQRAADAAALAASTHITDGTYLTVARSIASANGFTDGDNNGSIHVNASVINGNQVQVTITDDHLAQYFSKAFYNGTSMTRDAVGTYNPSIPLGSPENGLGMGNLYSTNATNVWTAVSGYCSAREQGDLVLSHADGELVSGAWNCGVSYSDSYAGSYNPAGYTFDVEVPAGRAQNLYIEAYDPAYVPYWYTFGTINYCGGTADAMDPRISPQLPNNAYQLTTTYKVTKPDGTTMTGSPISFLSKEDGPFGASHGDSADCKQWRTLATVAPGDPAGTYHIQVSTPANEPNSFGMNAFALEAVYGASSPTHLQRCTTIVGGSGYSATCAQIHAADFYPVYANADHNSGQFYLAAIDATHKGNTMTISLWDPGEGGQYIQVLDNRGISQTFNWLVTPCLPGLTTCNGTVLGSSNGLDVSGSATQPGVNRQGTGTYNDRMLTLTVQIPGNYDTYASTNGGWWKINYNGNGSLNVTDHTTWAVSVSGNPIHLVNG